MSNFVNEAIWGREVARYVGQGDFMTDLRAWWDSLDPIYKYAIIGGASLVTLLIVVGVVRRGRALSEMSEVRELLKLSMMKQLA